MTNFHHRLTTEHGSSIFTKNDSSIVERTIRLRDEIDEASNLKNRFNQLASFRRIEQLGSLTFCDSSVKPRKHFLFFVL